MLWYDMVWFIMLYEMLYEMGWRLTLMRLMRMQGMMKMKACTSFTS